MAKGREIEVPASVVSEFIMAFDHMPENSIRVHIGSGSGIPTDQVVIARDDYEELMSEDPSWAPGKKKDDFRLSDLWIFVDRARAQKGTTEITTEGSKIITEKEK